MIFFISKYSFYVYYAFPIMIVKLKSSHQSNYLLLKYNGTFQIGPPDNIQWLCSLLELNLLASCSAISLPGPVVENAPQVSR